MGSRVERDLGYERVIEKSGKNGHNFLANSISQMRDVARDVIAPSAMTSRMIGKGCYGCGAVDHFASDCPRKSQKEHQKARLCEKKSLVVLRAASREKSLEKMELRQSRACSRKLIRC